MKNFIKKYFPIESIVPLAFILLFQCCCYLIPKAFVENGIYFKMFNFTTNLDINTPFIPETIIIYFGCFVFWVLGIFFLFRTNDKKRCYDVVLSVLISHTICMIIYILMPTTTNLRPEISEVDANPFIKFLVSCCYGSDSPYNLFPSMHCTVSWFCYIAVRNRKEISLGYRIFSFVMCILVFISILTTKQHYIADILPSIILCELCYLLTRKTNISHKFMSLCTSINKFLKLDKYM